MTHATKKKLDRIDELYLNGNIQDAKRLAKQTSREAMMEYYAFQISCPDCREIIVAILGKVHKLKETK